MQMKARFMIMVLLLIILSFAVFQALLQIQNAGQPVATEDTCISIIEASLQPQDNTGSVVTEDPALESCLETLASTGRSATDTVNSASKVEGTDEIYTPITIVHSNILADAGRVWVIWHDPSTGALIVSLGAYNTMISYYNMGLDVTIPKDVVNIGIRIETTPDRDSGNWQFNPGCSFTFDKAVEGFSITVDDNNVCTGQSDSA